jgi:hypothetical protein
MTENIKNAIEKYQCPGCIKGRNITCFQPNENGGVGCGKHSAGTYIPYIGCILLGTPKGFNRLGELDKMRPNIFENYNDPDWIFDIWNIPVWKYLSEDGHTFIRGLIPRRNEPFLNIYLENCIDKVNCIEITEEIREKMD